MDTSYTWRDLENKFSDLSPHLKYARLDVQWGSVPTRFSVLGSEDFSALERFQNLSTIAGQKLFNAMGKSDVDADEDLLNETNSCLFWLKALKKFSGNFKTDYVGEHVGYGSIFTGRLYDIATASANLCLSASARFPDGHESDVPAVKKTPRRTRIPEENKTRAELQKEINSSCPFCSSADVGHFEIHHLDGNPSNNAFSNLLLLCPTCHSKITKEDIAPEEAKNKKESLALRTTRRMKQAGRKPLRQSIVGNNNIQVGHDLVVKPSRFVKHILLPPDTIGADPLLKQRITELFNKIGEEREKKFGKSAYGVMYRSFKKDFGIKNQSWTIVWVWPKEMADSIIDYLETKYRNTKLGRIENAFSRPGKIPAREYLYKREGELLEQLGLKMDSPEVRAWLKKYFGVVSHTKLSQMEHWQFVLSLESFIKKNIGE